MTLLSFPVCSSDFSEFYEVRVLTGKGHWPYFSDGLDLGLEPTFLEILTRISLRQREWRSTT